MTDGVRGRDRDRKGTRPTIVAGALLATVAALSVAGSADWSGPPRFDGAGYAVLARSLLERGDYREIDHPDAPRHAHFPPGYPALLALLWRVTGTSTAAAHVASAACTVAAVLVTWRWFRTLYRPAVAFGLGLALASNWTWGRVGASIQAEPPFLLATALVLLAATATGRRGGLGRASRLGLLLGATVLIRHVAICLAAAVALDLLLRGRRREAVAAVIVAGIVLAPWVAWVRLADRPSQADLLPRVDLPALIRANGLFYLRRLPDAIWGPLIEVGTVFRPSWRRPATWLAAAATGLIVGGWLRTVRTPRRRLAGLAAAATLALLGIWPFTEAGRFLIPLVPLILVGAVESLGGVGAAFGMVRPRERAVLIVIAASIPYAGYAAATDRAGALRATHSGFDAACAWLASAEAERPGPVLSRHPGEVFWRTGRTGLAPSSADPAAIDALIARHGVAYLLVDDDRFTDAPASPLGRFAVGQPGWPPAWTGEGVTVYGPTP